MKKTLLVTCPAPASLREEVRSALEGEGEILYLEDISEDKRKAALSSANVLLSFFFNKEVREEEYSLLADLDLFQSISAGLDYPGVGPEHSHLADTGRASYVSVTDDEAVEAFRRTCRLEGIIPALESSHALAHVYRTASSLPKDTIVLVNLSGRGDKDMDTILSLSKEERS